MTMRYGRPRDPRARDRGPCSRDFVRLLIVATVLTTACVSSLQATFISWGEDEKWDVRTAPGGPHPLEVGTESGDELSPCDPDHPNSIKGTGLFLSLQELDPDALVTDYFDAQTCQWDLLKLETYVVVTRMDRDKQSESDPNDDMQEERGWDAETSAYFDQVICVSGGVGTIWGMFNPPGKLIKLTAHCKEGGRCLGVFIGNLLIYIWCAIFLLGIPELVLVWVQCGWNQVAWLWVVWVTFFIARTQTAWIEYLRSSNWCRNSPLSFLCHVEDRLRDSPKDGSVRYLSSRRSSKSADSTDQDSFQSYGRAESSDSLDKRDDDGSEGRGTSLGDGLFNPHSLELFSGWERWDWVDLGVFAGMVVFVAGVSVQLLESCGWDCLAYFVLVVSGIDEVVWLWRSKKSGSGGSARRSGLPRSLLLRRNGRRKSSSAGGNSDKKKNGSFNSRGHGSKMNSFNGDSASGSSRSNSERDEGGWGYGEGLGLHMWLWLAGAVVLCTWRASVSLHLLFLFAFCVYHWTMKEKLPHFNF
mmetsp:Transcript_5480/g.13353  ORF Transcript_5480/g.13353 Transcript_5480/m.13353 type:complete len:528 (-) Transcript_5480:263-1846(-)